MSVYDYIKVQHPMLDEAVWYKTYDTLSMHHDHYVVREDGYLYREERLDSILVPVTREVVFGNEDVQYSAYFVKGRMAELHELELEDFYND